MASEGEGMRNMKASEQPREVEPVNTISPADHGAKEKKTMGRTPDGKGIPRFSSHNRTAPVG